MKKSFLLIFLLSSLFYFSQSNAHHTDHDEVTESVDKVAEFEGGFNNFRQLAAEGFISKNVKCAKGISKATARFVVERDGTISNIKMMGENGSLNNEVERVIKSIRNKWKPALVKGTPVRSYYNFPFNLSCD